MATFYGTEIYSIDEKGRIVVPASMRASAGHTTPVSTFILVKGYDPSLWLYTEEEWGPIEQRLSKLSRGSKEERALARAFLTDACKVTVDKQGRITIPPSLIGRAGLGKEAKLHGHVGRIEIWAPEVYDENTAPYLENMDDINEKLLKEDA